MTPKFLAWNVPLFFLFFINIILPSFCLYSSIILTFSSIEQSSTNIISILLNDWYWILPINLIKNLSLLKTGDIIEIIGLYIFLNVFNFFIFVQKFKYSIISIEINNFNCYIGKKYII